MSLFKVFDMFGSGDTSSNDADLFATNARIVAEARVDLPTAGSVGAMGGAQGRNRTTDTVIFSHVLYQLSYLGLSLAERKQRL